MPLERPSPILHDGASIVHKNINWWLQLIHWYVFCIESSLFNSSSLILFQVIQLLLKLLVKGTTKLQLESSQEVVPSYQGFWWRKKNLRNCLLFNLHNQQSSHKKSQELVHSSGSLLKQINEKNMLHPLWSKRLRGSPANIKIKNINYHRTFMT